MEVSGQLHVSATVPSRKYFYIMFCIFVISPRPVATLTKFCIHGMCNVCTFYIYPSVYMCVWMYIKER